MTSLVRYERAAQVATITLDSPANRNALSAALLTELHDAVAGALTDPAVRVIVLTGSGPVFCAGADLKESRQRPAAAAALFPQILQLIWDSDKPVVCRANGTARAGGIGLIAACDIAIAPESATFAFTEVRVGVAAAIIAVPCLRRWRPEPDYEYFLTGETFDAVRAAQDRTAHPRRAGYRPRRRKAGRYVTLLLRGAPGALAATKAILREVPGLPWAEGLARMAELSASGSASPGGPGGDGRVRGRTRRTQLGHPAM